jgi:phage replication O-like protein O
MKKLAVKGYFTIVENEILDFLPLIGLSKRELEFMIVAVRLLNGFDKEKDRIPLSQFQKLTGVSKNNGSITVKKLIKKKMLYKNEGRIGINRDFSQWEGVLNLRTHKGFSVWTQKVLNSYDKKVLSLGTSKETLKETIQTKENFYKKLSEKEIDKLEGDHWYKAIMYNHGGFSIFYIQGTIDDFPFNTRMGCWYLYEEAKNIRDKEAYFSKLLREYQED